MNVSKVGLKVVLPQIIAQEPTREIHTVYGHTGPLKCFKMIEEDFCATKFKKLVCATLRTCDVCQRTKTYTQSSAGKTQPIVPKGVADLVSIDYYGPLPTSRSGTKYILAAIDAFSKFVVLYPIRSATARITIKKIFEDYVPRFGKPRRLSFDHGTQFTSPVWTKKLENEEIKNPTSGR